MVPLPEYKKLTIVKINVNSSQVHFIISQYKMLFLKNPLLWILFIIKGSSKILLQPLAQVLFGNCVKILNCYEIFRIVLYQY